MRIGGEGRERKISYKAIVLSDQSLTLRPSLNLAVL